MENLILQSMLQTSTVTIKILLTKRIRFYLVTLLACLASSQIYSMEQSIWSNGKTAISLSYDDALHSQLDNALPALDRHGFNASFYVVPTSDAFQSRLEEWRVIAKQGHELGNHSLTHSCSGSLPDREWVEDDRDLDTQSLEQVVFEIRLANVLLQALDGTTQRTFTIPCGDVLANGKNYVEVIEKDFLAIKGQGIATGFSSLYAPAGDSAQDLIHFVQEQTGKVELINILFHGVGGDHLSVTTETHDALLAFLADNQNVYWVDTYLNIMNAKLTRSRK